MVIVSYITAALLIALGLYTLIAKKELMKMVIGICLFDYGANLLLVTVGFNPGGTAPIFSFSDLQPGMFFVDPVPQALTLTAIVIGACVTALALALVVKLKQKFGTTNTDDIRRLRG